jgi:hypothetical protein
MNDLTARSGLWLGNVRGSLVVNRRHHRSGCMKRGKYEVEAKCDSSVSGCFVARWFGQRAVRTSNYEGEGSFQL